MANNGKRTYWRGVPKVKSDDHNRKKIENLSKANAVKKKLEFLPIFPYSELLIWMQAAPNVTDRIILILIVLFENIHSSFFSGKLKTFDFYLCIVDLRNFFWC